MRKRKAGEREKQERERKRETARGGRGENDRETLSIRRYGGVGRNLMEEFLSIKQAHNPRCLET